MFKSILSQGVNIIEYSFFTEKDIKCSYCGFYHNGICNRVKKIEYNLDGTIKSVELFPYYIERKEQ